MSMKKKKEKNEFIEHLSLKTLSEEIIPLIGVVNSLMFIIILFLFGLLPSAQCYWLTDKLQNVHRKHFAKWNTKTYETVMFWDHDYMESKKLDSLYFLK
jgi:hypothetical protein